MIAAAGGEAKISVSFQALETGWLGQQFLGNRLASSEGAVSTTKLLTVTAALMCDECDGVLCGPYPDTGTVERSVYRHVTDK